MSSPSYKNPLLTCSHLNHPKKDSVITLPRFATSTPICRKNVSTKEIVITLPDFKAPSTSIGCENVSRTESVITNPGYSTCTTPTKGLPPT